MAENTHICVKCTEKAVCMTIMSNESEEHDFVSVHRVKAPTFDKILPLHLFVSKFGHSMISSAVLNNMLSHISRSYVLRQSTIRKLSFFCFPNIYYHSLWDFYLAIL